MRASAGHDMFAHSTLLVAHPLLTKPLVLPEAKAHSALKAHLLLFNEHICPAHLSKLVAPAPQLVEVKSVAPSAGFWLEDTARLPADIKVRSASCDERPDRFSDATCEVHRVWHGRRQGGRQPVFPVRRLQQLEVSLAAFVPEVCHWH